MDNNRFKGSLSVLEELLKSEVEIHIPNYIIYTIGICIFFEYLFFRIQSMNEYTNDHAFKRISVQSHRWLEENVIEMLEKKEYSIKRDEIIDVRNQLASILTDVSILQKEVIIDNVKQDEIIDLRQKLASSLTDVSLLQKELLSLKMSNEIIVEELEEIELKMDKNLKDYCAENILIITEYVEEKVNKLEENNLIEKNYNNKQIEEKINKINKNIKEYKDYEKNNDKNNDKNHYQMKQIIKDFDQNIRQLITETNKKINNHEEQITRISSRLSSTVDNGIVSHNLFG